MWLDTFNKMRHESGLSLDELSEKSGIPKGTLAKITSGITKAPSLETMRSLVYAMGYTLDDLDKGTIKKKAPAPSEDSTRAISVEALEAMLIQGGFIRPDDDLSDDDLDFLLSVGRIVETWFRKRQKHGGE